MKGKFMELNTNERNMKGKWNDMNALERKMHAWKDLEHADFHKTLESDRAPQKR